MNLDDVVRALPTLDRKERRKLARRIFDFADEETALLAECDRRAEERFLILDEMETQDGETRTRPCLDGSG